MKLLILFLCMVCAMAPGAVSEKRQPLNKTLRETLQQALLDPVRLEIDAPPVPAHVPDDAQLILQNSSPPFGMVRMAWQWQEADEVKSHRTHAVVRGYSLVAVAKRPIAQGQVFSREDLDFVEKEVSRFGISGFFASYDELKGLMASQYIRPGETLGAGNTVKPYEIVRGQLGEVASRRGGISISARVEALQNGRTGDWIQVKNIQTQKTFRARVQGPGSLRVD